MSESHEPTTFNSPEGRDTVLLLRIEEGERPRVWCDPCRELVDVQPSGLACGHTRDAAPRLRPSTFDVLDLDEFQDDDVGRVHDAGRMARMWSRLAATLRF